MGAPVAETLAVLGRGEVLARLALFREHLQCAVNRAEPSPDRGGGKTQ